MPIFHFWKVSVTQTTVGLKKMIQMLCVPNVASISPSRIPFKRNSPPPPILNPPLLIRFRTSHRENLRYLKNLNIISTNKFFSPQKVDYILSIVNFLKSKGFSDPHIQRIAFLCPQLFSGGIEPTDIAPVFEFFISDLSASQDQSCGLILRCPNILFSDVDQGLKPSLSFLKDLGLRNLTSPTTLNAHLLNTRVEKFVQKIRFLESLGLSNEEARQVCGRLPAIFGYSIENNLRPKFEYLIEDMERSVEELKGFPQYFGFSLEKRIVPRHLHLKERNVYVPLQRMLLWSDQRFYNKWK